jgi:hypothetical protein
VRLAVFGLLLAAAFGGAALAGGALDPDAAPATPAHAAEPGTPAAHGGSEGRAAPAGHGAAAAHAAAVGSAALPGLSAEQDGLRLELLRSRSPAGASRPLALRIVDARGEPVRRFDVAHEKRLHLIVVRRDLATFEHLHPRMDDGGVWRTAVDLRRPGSYRVFADVTVGGRKRTLGTDLHVAGDFRPRRLPAATSVATDDHGLDVRLRRTGDRVAFDVLRDGRVVNAELETYLGAKGHLVTLRAADLAYLHAHPENDALAFEARVPSPGTFRHHVQFQLDGVVHTAAFTEEVKP